MAPAVLVWSAVQTAVWIVALIAMALWVTSAERTADCVQIRERDWPLT
jgi:hypothetical protein